MSRKLSPLKAIRSKCLDCMCGQAREVQMCPSEDCSLYVFRYGKNPSRSGIGNKGANPPKRAVSSSKMTNNGIVEA